MQGEAILKKKNDTIKLICREFLKEYIKTYSERDVFQFFTMKETGKNVHIQAAYEHLSCDWLYFLFCTQNEKH